MLRLALNIIYREFWLLFLSTLFAGVTVFLILDQRPDLYRGSVLLLVGPSTSSPNPELNDLRTSGQLLETYAVLATTRPVLEDLIAELNLDMVPDDLEKMIEINTTPETQILRLRVFSEDPDEALLIANTLATYILKFSPLGPDYGEESPFRIQLQEQINRLQDRINNSEMLLAELQESLNNATTRDERVAILNDILQERARLSETEQFLVSLYDTLQRPATNRIEIVEPATEARKVDSQKQIQTVMGAVAGLVFGLVIATAVEYFDDTMTGVDDLLVLKDPPVLGTISRASNKKARTMLDITDQSSPVHKRVEEYRNLATQLTMRLWDQDASPRFQPSRTILVTFTPKDVDTSDVAINLSMVLTQLGMRVTLMDVNYEVPGGAKAISFSGEDGLSEAIANGGELNHVSLDNVQGLTIIPSGKAPASSFALLASEEMGKIIDDLKQQTDLLLISAADLSSSDTAILASRVDASVILTLGGKSRRSILESGIQSLKQKPIFLVFIDQTTGLRRYLGQKASM